MESKGIHIITAAAFLFVTVVTMTFVVDLRKDIVTALGTIGFFVTVYGVAFTIIEVLRVKSAAQEAAIEAKRASHAVRTLYGISNLSECQSRIEFALECIDKDGFVPLSSLAHIVKLYSAEFAKEYRNENSTCRHNVGLVQSYASLHTPKSPAPASRLKDTLLAMIADLSVSGTAKIEEAHI